MALLPFPWPEGFWHRYISKQALIQLLSNLPDDSLVFVNDVGNLWIGRGNPEQATPIGYIEIGDESFTAF